jgi:hypothetical protein
MGVERKVYKNDLIPEITNLLLLNPRNLRSAIVTRPFSNYYHFPLE